MKYRYKILRGEVAERARPDLIRQICQAREVIIIRERSAGSHPHAGVITGAACVLEAGAVHKRAIVAAVAGGVSAPAEEILGLAPVGARVFLRDGGRDRRGNDQSLY